MFFSFVVLRGWGLSWVWSVLGLMTLRTHGWFTAGVGDVVKCGSDMSLLTVRWRDGHYGSLEN